MGQGLTLLELLVAVLVVAVLLGTGVPAFGEFIAEGRRAAEVNAFVHAVHLARNEALKRHEYVSLCRSADGRRCGAQDWGEGWILFVDLDRDQPPQRDDGEPLLIVRSAWRHGSVHGNRAAFTLRPFTLRATNGTLIFCDRRGARAARAVIVSYTGRPRTDRLDAAGRPLVCPRPAE